jgi:methyltransferase (TIGR00027 family)
VRRNRPSRSARSVARAVAFLALDPEVAPVLPAGLAATNHRLLVAAGQSERRLRGLGRPWVRRLVRFIEAQGAGGQVLFVGMRKRLVTDEAAAALTSGAGGPGYRQLLVLGGGLDSLALRLAAAHPQVTCLEVDHPASQAVKRRALAQLGPLPPNLHLAPADLGAGELAAVLAAQPSWDRELPTFVVVEAVLMYLDAGAVKQVLQQLHGGTGAGSELLFSYLRRDARGRFLIGRSPRLASLLLVLSGEPLRWGVAAGELAGFLAAAGWRLEVERYDLRTRYLEPAGLGNRPLADIEVYARAGRS